MLEDEVNANNEETRTLCELWLESLQLSCEKTRKMFGFKEEEMSVDWRVKPKEEQTKQEYKEKEDAN